MAKKKGAISNAYAIYDINDHYMCRAVGSADECAAYIGIDTTNLFTAIKKHRITRGGFMVEKIGKVKEVFGDAW